jgi:putative membrane protein
MRLNRIATLVTAAALATAWTGVGAAGDLAHSGERKGSLSAADKKFLDDAYSINQGEILLGHLAQQNGTSQSVKDFGQRMVLDHTQGLNAERLVAAKVQAVLPTDVDQATRAQYDDLSRKSGRDFDTAYGDAMVSGHEAAIREFGDEAASSTNSVIKGYAQSALPMLREHLKQARAMAQSLRPGVTEPQRP